MTRLDEIRARHARLTSPTGPVEFSDLDDVVEDVAWLLDRVRALEAERTGAVAAVEILREEGAGSRALVEVLRNERSDALLQIREAAELRQRAGDRRALFGTDDHAAAEALRWAAGLFGGTP
jgi:hypothetical protein